MGLKTEVVSPSVSANMVALAIINAGMLCCVFFWHSVIALIFGLVYDALTVAQYFMQRRT